MVCRLCAAHKKEKILTLCQKEIPQKGQIRLPPDWFSGRTPGWRSSGFRAQCGVEWVCTYRGGEDTEVRLGDDDGARLEGGGGASAELHLRIETGMKESAMERCRMS